MNWHIRNLEKKALGYQITPFTKIKKFYQQLLHKRNFGDCNFSEVAVQFSQGNPFTLSTGKYARFTDGCAVGAAGNTSVLVTAVSSEKPSTSNFIPLVVDYRQKAAAAGRIPTNFLRRELGPSEHEILTSRLIDRSIRPLFPASYYHDTQIVCNTLAIDGTNYPDVIAINAASAALSLSDIPWNGPVGAVRVGLSEDNLLLNPTRKELANSSLNLIVVAANQNLVIMLEGCANNILINDFQKAIKFGVKECQNVISSINQLQKECGKPKRAQPRLEEPDANVTHFIKSLSELKLKEIFANSSYDKIGRDVAVQELKASVISKLKDGGITSPNAEEYCSSIFDKLSKEKFRSQILDNGRRCDGRDFDEIRKISCELDLYSPLHGSALFQRGQTQVLCTVALDSIESSLKLDATSVITSGLKEKNFFLHYDFPPYATNEIATKSGGSSMRREIGHGALAEKALRPVIPSDFPFAIRLTSEVLESNGSSSMASVCGGSLALMDAGVPISNAVAGVAIGLVTKYDNNDTKHIKQYQLLTDILGIEDYMGDMDFKIAGTKNGISAVQADIKIAGLPLKVAMEAVQAGFDAKAKIISIMDEAINKPREPKKPNWPVCERLEIEPHKRGKFVGPGAINLKRLMIETGVQVTSNEDGIFSIFAPNQDAMDEAKEQIEKILKEPSEPQLEFGAIYKAKIVEVREMGVLVVMYDTMTPALLHNSQLDQRKVNHPSALGLQVGDEIQVKYFGRDPVSGMMRLSRKILQGPASNVIRNLNKASQN